MAEFLGPFELGRVHCVDCLEALPMLPVGSVDAVITDPPYGIGEAAGKNRSRTTKGIAAKDYGFATWDDAPPPLEAFLQMRRASKEQVIFGGNYFTFALPPSPSWIVWDKDNSGDFADCELAWTSHKRAVRKVTWRWNGMLQENMANKEERVHPTQKPVGVMTWIIRNYTKPNDLILDPYSGSGTTGVAAVQLGRRFLGFEIDPHYTEIANKRIEAARQGVTVKELEQGQGTLFM
jgi:DNA modification methylase